MHKKLLISTLLLILNFTQIINSNHNAQAKDISPPNSSIAPDIGDISQYKFNSTEPDRIIVNLTKEANLTVYTRSNRIWLLFDVPIKDIVSYNVSTQHDGEEFYPFTLGNMQKIDIITYPSSLAKNVTMFSIPLKYQGNSPSILAQKSGKRWIITIAKSPNVLFTNHQNRALVLPYKNEEVEIKTSVKIAKEITFIDPIVGDLLTAVLNGESGIIVTSEKHFVDFSILSSNHGLLIQNKVDDLVVEKKTNSLIIKKNKPAKLNIDFSSDFDAPPVLGPDKNTRSILNLDLLGEGDEFDSDFSEQLTAMNYKLSYLSYYDRARLMFDIARFYFKNGWFRESIDMMDFAVSFAPAMQRDYRLFLMYFLALSALDKLRYEVDIDKIEMSIVPENRTEEVEFLRKITKYISPYYQSNIEKEYNEDYFINADYSEDNQRKNIKQKIVLDDLKFLSKIYKEWDKNFLREYPRYWKARFGFALVNMGIKISFLSFAQEMLNLSNKFADDGDYGRIILYQGRIDEGSGNNSKALNLYEKCSNAEDSLLKIECQYAKNKILLKMKQLSPKNYINNLENISKDWYGDVLQAIILREIAEEYKKQDNYPYAIKNWQKVISNSSSSILSTYAHKNIIETFVNFYDEIAEGKRETSPLKKIAFYYEFKQYLPIGKKGDEIMVSLFDDFLKLGIWKNAAAIIRYQIVYNLSYYKKEEYIYKLAQIYLDNQLYKQAYDTLTNLGLGWRNFSGKLAEKQKGLMVQTLIGLKKYQEAENIMKDDFTEEADDIMANMYWNTNQWNEFINRAEPALYRWRKNKYTIIGYDNVFERDLIIKQPKYLSGKEAQRVLELAIAYNMLKNKRLYNEMYTTVRERIQMGAEDSNFTLKTLDFFNQSSQMDFGSDYYSLQTKINNLRKIMDTKEQ